MPIVLIFRAQREMFASKKLRSLATNWNFGRKILLFNNGIRDAWDIIIRRQVNTSSINRVNKRLENHFKVLEQGSVPLILGIVIWWAYCHEGLWFVWLICYLYYHEWWGSCWQSETFNLTKAELDDYFGGPGFLAWARMGNLKRWEISPQFR